MLRRPPISTQTDTLCPYTTRVRSDIKLSWGEFTGRVGLDWSPQLEFTDDTLLYAFYSRGYKAGGMNPPSPGFITKEEILEAGYLNPVFLPIYEQLGIFPEIGRAHV